MPQSTRPLQESYYSLHLTEIETLYKHTWLKKVYKYNVVEKYTVRKGMAFRAFVASHTNVYHTPMLCWMESAKATSESSRNHNF